MRRGSAWLLLAAVCGCAPQRPPVRVPTEAALPAGLCRVGADGGIPLADRGIGGTGSPAVRVADRGIGGTGSAIRTAPGQVGIVGVITGFASVCLAGQEVEYGPDLPILVDGRAAGPDSLRAGQVAVVVAAGTGPVAGPAVSLAVRHEVSGPVERVDADGTLLVAGQRVLPPPGPAFSAGRWVMVSGFRRADGAVLATRLDPREPGEVMVRGIMRQERERLWIGLVEVRPGRFQERRAGVPVVAVGRLNPGVLEADTVEPDGLLLDPARFFGPAVGTIVVEGYAEGGLFRFGPGLGIRSGFEGRGLARLQRGPGGTFTPDTVRPHAPAGPAVGPAFGPAGRPGAAFAPAPTPNRGMERAGMGGPAGRGGPAGPGREGQNRDGPNRRGGEGGLGRRSGEAGEASGGGPGFGGGSGPGGFRGGR